VPDPFDRPGPFAGASAAAVDRGAVQQLQDQLGPDGLTELVTTFLARTPDRLAALRAVAGTGDAPALRERAHSLKGSARSFGAAEMGEIAARIEHESAAGSLSRADQLVTELACAFERTQVELEQHLARNGSGDPDEACGHPATPAPSAAETRIAELERRVASLERSIASLLSSA
jgi:HPt (histidine-containing phosphotransfer) domain-containing protein